MKRQDFPSVFFILIKNISYISPYLLQRLVKSLIWSLLFLFVLEDNAFRFCCFKLVSYVIVNNGLSDFQIRMQRYLYMPLQEVDDNYFIIMS